MKRVFTAGAIAVAIVVLGPSVAYAALVAEWKMDETSGSTMFDSASGIGGANNGTINSVVIGVDPLVSGRAYQFDGATSYISVPDNDALDPGNQNITLQATVKIEDGQILDDSYDIVRKGVTTTAGGNWKMEIKRSGTDTTVGKLLCVFKGVVSSGSRVAVQRIASVDIVDSRSHTLKCIKTATSVQAVVDGRIFTNTKAAGSIANTQDVLLGSKVAGDDVFQGVIDQVTIDIG